MVDQLDGHDVDIPGYHRYFYDAQRKGYSGVALYAKRKTRRGHRGFGVAEFDDEGRYDEGRASASSPWCRLYLPSGSAGRGRPRSTASSTSSCHGCRA